MRWIINFAVLCTGLLVFIFLTIWGFNGFHGTGLDLAGTIAVTLGTVVTAALGVALMGLVFYSDRNGYDERAGNAGRGPDQLPH